MNRLTEYLHTLPFWDNLTEAEKNLLCDNAYVRFFDKDSYFLHSKTDEDFGLMLLIEGKIRAFLLSQDGREITLFSLRNQSICVFSALSLFKQISFQVFLTADCHSKVLVINMSVMERLMEDNIYFRCFAYELIAERFSSVMDSFRGHLFYGLEQRLANFLMSEYDHHGKAQICLTHEHIARHVGTSRECITKTLKKLSDKNLISKSKGCIEITDVKRLRETAKSLDF